MILYLYVLLSYTAHYSVTSVAAEMPTIVKSKNMEPTLYFLEMWQTPTSRHGELFQETPAKGIKTFIVIETNTNT